MAEYIDKEAAIERYQNEVEIFGIVESEDGKETFGLVKDLDVIAFLQSLPAANVRENVKARWELHGGDDDLCCYYFCSNCHAGYDEEWFFVHGEYHPLVHCPCCGAKMEVQDG